MTLAAEKYLSITTTKRNGDAVSSPVWIASLPDGRLGFTTDSSSGKVKRIRNFPAVTLQACDMRGRVKAGSQPVPATAIVLIGADAAPVKAAIRSKYGVMVPITNFFYVVRGMFSKHKADEPDCAISLQLD